VVYIERLPDTVQKDHIDWGFRVAGIYGENYRYTTAYGVFSNQLLKSNAVNGFDLPMVYGELFIPQPMEGLLIRVGRYISIPDIEAQLAPNNYMYMHSMTYTFDNYTNTGIQTTLAVTKNWFLQLGLSVGTEAPPWHAGVRIPNPFPNPLYPDTTMLKDPGAIPSLTAGVRWTSDNGNDSFYVVADGINSGVWGYNNLQWYGVTYYHKINDQWHISFETYNLHQNKVPNILNPTVTNIIAGEDFLPTTLDFAFVDECYQVTDKECFLTARELTRKEGLFSGGSAGGAVCGAIKFAKEYPQCRTIVVILPDSGSRYLSKVYDDDWLRANSFLDDEAAYGHLKDIVERQRHPVITAEASDGVQDVIRLMKKHGISQLPILDRARLVGMISEVDLLNALLKDPDSLDRPVGDLVDQNYVLVPSDTPVSRLAQIFTQGKVALVQDQGTITAVVTKIDLIDHMTASVR